MRRVAAGVPARRKVTTAPSPFLTPAPLLRSSLPSLDATSPREMPPFPSKGAALLPIPRGKKYFNIYLKVSAGNGISPSLTPPLPQSDYGNPGYGSARFSVFSLSTNTVESMILPRRSNSRIRGRKDFFSFRKRFSKIRMDEELAEEKFDLVERSW